MSRSTESAAHDPLRIGVSGLGSIGSRHARLLSGMDGVQLAVCDVNAESLRATQRLPSVQRVTDSYSELLAWELDGIVIATPEGLHVEQGIAVAQCGRPLLVEKPLAETAADARRLRQCVEKYGVPAMTGYVLRYTSVMRLARDLLDQKMIGRPGGLS